MKEREEKDNFVPIMITPRGVNNVDDPSSQVFQPPVDKQDPPPFLYKAENVDIDRNGIISRRRGRTKLADLTDGRALASFSKKMLCVSGDTLFDALPNNTLVPIASGLPTKETVMWTEYGGSIWWGCGGVRGSIRGSSSWVWGLPTPKILSVQATSGQLKPGRYMVSVTVEKDGLESGAPAPHLIELTSQGGIAVQISSDINADVTNLYCTDADEKTLYFAASSYAGSSNVIETVMTTDPLEFLSCNEPPIGSIVAGFNGRLLISSYNILYWSLPGAYHHWRTGIDLQMFPERITMIAPLGKGFFVGTEQMVYWVQGDDPENWSPVDVDQKPALDSQPLYLEGRKIPEIQTTDIVCLWASNDGLVVGFPNGSTKHLTDGVISTSRYKYATIAYREDRSLRQILLGLREETSTSNFGTSDTATCRIVRAKT